MPLLLLGCGGRATGAQADAGEAGSSASSGGAGVVQTPTPAAGASPVAVDEPTPSDISGRWGLFEFEDPVGVQLTQSGSVLSGRGCAGGAPPTGAACGDIKGRVEGTAASFGFQFDVGGYAAETTVSADGRRMTGRFLGLGGFLPYPTAWLRIPDDQAWLSYPAAKDDALNGNYDLRLAEASAGANDYVPERVYSLRFYEGAIASDLGSFWSSEIVRSDGSLAVGPVAATTPELAVSMSIASDAQGFTKVRATTASGHTYAFRAVRNQH